MCYKGVQNVRKESEEGKYQQVRSSGGGGGGFEGVATPATRNLRGVSRRFGVISKTPKHFCINRNLKITVLFCYKLPFQCAKKKDSFR